MNKELPLPRIRTEEIRQAREEGQCPLATYDWYRLPELFQAGLETFGRAWYNDHGGSRKLMETQTAKMCGIWKQKYPGACTPNRHQKCAGIMLEAMLATQLRNRHIPAQPWLIAVMCRATNDERTHELLKDTVPHSQLVLRSIFKTLK